MMDTRTAPPVAEIAERVETIRETLYPERCVRVMGERVLLKRGFLNSVNVRMVDRGFFPLSPTGYRSIQTPYSFGDEVATDTLYDFIEAGLEDMAEERMVVRDAEIKRFRKQAAAERAERWEEGAMVRKVIRMTTSRGWIEDRIMTARERDRNTIVEAAIRLYSHAAAFPRATQDTWKGEPVRWTLEMYNQRLDRAKEKLQTFEAAYESGGLFGTPADFRPVLENASCTIRRAYGARLTTREGRIYREDVACDVRAEVGVEALEEGHLNLLAQRLVEAGFE